MLLLFFVFFALSVCNHQVSDTLRANRQFDGHADRERYTSVMRVLVELVKYKPSPGGLGDAYNPGHLQEGDAGESWSSPED